MLFQLKKYNFQGDLQCCHHRCNNNWRKLSDRIINQHTFDISLFNGTNWNATEQIIYEYEFLDIFNILNFLVGSFEKVSRISVISSSQLQQTEFFFYLASALPFGLPFHPLPFRRWALLPLPNCMQAVFPSLPQLHHIELISAFLCTPPFPQSPP